MRIEETLFYQLKSELIDYKGGQGKIIKLWEIKKGPKGPLIHGNLIITGELSRSG